MRRLFARPGILAALLALLVLAACNAAPPALRTPATEPGVPEPSGVSDPDETPDTEPTAIPAQPEPSAAAAQVPLPEGFSYVRDLNPGIRVELRYATAHNFTGSIVDGYYSTGNAIMLTDAATALGKVQEYLETQGLGLLVYDAYRPAKAVAFFYNWSQNDGDDTKEEFYPNHAKTELFGLGYIAQRSRHSCGVAADLTLADGATGEAVDMGGSFDLFDDRSHHDFAGLTEEQKANRKQLKAAMEKFGFSAFNDEWWHYSYKTDAAEAYDFDVR